MLRLVSFNMDYYWASRNPRQPVEARFRVLLFSVIITHAAKEFGNRTID
jgi:hypothetical protein